MVTKSVRGRFTRQTDHVRCGNPITRVCFLANAFVLKTISLPTVEMAIFSAAPTAPSVYTWCHGDVDHDPRPFKRLKTVTITIVIMSFAIPGNRNRATAKF